MEEYWLEKYLHRLINERSCLDKDLVEPPRRAFQNLTNFVFGERCLC
jgi:hypothetical protein